MLTPADPWASMAIGASPEPWSPPDDHGEESIDPNEVDLVWVVYPPNTPLQGAEPSMLQRVDLEVSTRNMMMQTTHLPNEFGSLVPYNQLACGGAGYPLEKGELAKITFYEGGAGGYFVKRAGDALTVSEWSQTDGACENARGDLVACPRSVKRVARIRLKANPDEKFFETIFEVDDKGVRTRLDCGEK